MHYGYNGARWYTQEVEEDVPSSTSEPPPLGPWVAPVEGEPWPRWVRVGWDIQAYVPIPVVRRLITRLAFLLRFTDDEAIGIDLASVANTVPGAALRRFMAKVNAAPFIDLDWAFIRNGLQALENRGLLDVGRPVEILDAPVLDSEQYPPRL